MKQLFPGYYRPSESEFAELWKDCIFVFDTNILLNLYRYSEETRGKLLDILNQIADRIWIPYQVAYEYQKNRIEVIEEQLSAYDKVKDALKDSRSNLETAINKYKGKHLLLDVNHVLDQVDKTRKRIEKQLVGQLA